MTLLVWGLALSRCLKGTPFRLLWVGVTWAESSFLSWISTGNQCSICCVMTSEVSILASWILWALRQIFRVFLEAFKKYGHQNEPLFDYGKWHVLWKKSDWKANRCNGPIWRRHREHGQTLTAIHGISTDEVMALFWSEATFLANHSPYSNYLSFHIPPLTHAFQKPLFFPLKSTLQLINYILLVLLNERI